MQFQSMSPIGDEALHLAPVTGSAGVFSVKSVNLAPLAITYESIAVWSALRSLALPAGRPISLQLPKIGRTGLNEIEPKAGRGGEKYFSCDTRSLEVRSKDVAI